MGSREIYWQLFLVLTLHIFTRDILAGCLNSNCSLDSVSETEQSTRVLSRRKRFLVFPDGSSFQLVFCVQTAALIPIGDIFLYSNTAALAWNLPTDPEFFTMFKNHDKSATNAQRKGDLQKNVYLIKDGKFLAKVPYKRKPIVNPAFAKRSADNPAENRQRRPDMAIVKKWVHEKQSRRAFLKKEHWEESSVRFHRLSRVSLFEKLEALFQALGQSDGRQCVMRQLCRAAQTRRQQGNFLQELLRVVFTLPKGEEFEKEEHRTYDDAHTVDVDCSALYPDCENFDV